MKRYTNCWGCGAELSELNEWWDRLCHQCSHELHRRIEASRRVYEEVEARGGGTVRTSDGPVPVNIATGAANPQTRWRGWRDRQPKRNPVTVRRIDEAGR